MESLQAALQTAQTFSPDYEILSTMSGGWSLQKLTGGGSVVNYLVHPSAANNGETGRPYQAWFKKRYQNFATLNDALETIHA